MPPITILCVGNPENPHIKEVEKYVKALDKEARMIIFNFDFTSEQNGDFIEITAGNVDPSFSCTFIVNGERVSAESITSVWFYPKPSMPPEKDDLQGRIASAFVGKEWGGVLYSLQSYLPHARWLNPLIGSSLRNCKPYQLKLAQEVGFTVPKTTITNNAAALEKLFNDGRVVFKAMTPLITSPDAMVFTKEIAKEFPSCFEASIAKCPSIYQKLVERRSDLRITVVGPKVFAVRIASQTLDEAKDRLDWRRRQDKDEIFSEAQISEPFKERLMEFHKRAGLVYGAYDFLEHGPDIIFLECNPAGAWLWLEKAVGIRVSEHIARYLLGMDESEKPYATR